MTPTRRQALAAGMLGLAATRLPAAVPPALELATFSTEVTCPIGHALMGGGIAPAKEILEPLEASGLVFRGSTLGKPVAIVAVDWCEIRNGAYDAWRTAIAKAIGTDPVRVLVSSLHQHDTPIADLEAEALLRANKCAGSICDPEFHAKVVQRVAASAKLCLNQMQAVTHVGTGQAEVKKLASNRRYTDEKGIVRYNRMSATRDAAIRAAEEGTIDPFAKTLSFWNGDQALAAISGYAIHPMSYYGRGGVSTDFVGMARKRLQAETPKVPQLYVSGCSGNVTAGKYNDGATENRAMLADRLYAGLHASWKATKRIPVKDVQFRSVPITLQARNSVGFSEKELTTRLTADAKPFGQCLAALGLSWLKRVNAGTPVDLPVLDFGSAVYALLPAEAYIEFQLHTQQQRPSDFVLVSGYGECGPGYIPIERAWKENDSNLHDWSWVRPGSEAIVKDAIAKALKR